MAFAAILFFAESYSFAVSAGPTDRLFETRLFAQPLVWVGQNKPSDAESKMLWSAFGVEKSRPLGDSIPDIESFIASNPSSAWTPSLNCNLGDYYREKGYFSQALSHWQAAWDGSKNLNDLYGRRVADYSLAHLLRLLCSLGRTEAIKTIFEQTKGRQMNGAMRQIYDQCRESYSMMLTQPGKSYRCGTAALGAMVQAVFKTNNLDILEKPSPQTGFSMEMLLGLAKQNHYDFEAVQRPQGDASLVVPSVVHWKQNHYAAILARHGKLYEVSDPTFRLNTWLTPDAINAECSGQFIVPSETKPNGWSILSSLEAGKIFGKGFAYPIIPPPGPPCTNTCGCLPGGGGGGAGGGGGGCTTCPKSVRSVGAMPDWIVLEPYIDLWVHDEPLAYQPSIGARISFLLHYWQRDDNTVDPAVFGVGQGWNCSWLSYVDFSQFESGGSVTLYPAGGGQRTYNNFDGTIPEYFTNTRMMADTNSTGSVTDFKIISPSGAVDVYGFLRTNLNGSIFQAYLSQQIDASGRTNTFSYAPYDPNSTAVQLEYVIDGSGGTNTISYTNVTGFSDYLIHAVTDPYGRTALFEYDTNGCLIKTTDVESISSSFLYDPSQGYWMTNMTTPYGPTEFAFTDIPNPVDDYSITRSVIISEPDGSHRMFMLRENSLLLNNSDSTPLVPETYSDPGNVPTVRPTGSTLDNPDWANPANNSDLMNYRNSYYWGKQQFSHLSSSFLSTSGAWNFNQMTTNDYLLARLRHWNHASQLNGELGNSLSMERDFSPDGVTSGKMTWYDYPGKANFYTEGTSAFPSLIIKVLPDGSEWYQQFQMDQFGNRTNVISTYSNPEGYVQLRTNSYVYASNGQDLLNVIGPDGVTNESYSYDSCHQVLAMTNALKEATRYSYNGQEQVISVSYPSGLIETNIYGNDGFLFQKIDEGFSTNTYFYAKGLVVSRTDARGLTVTNSWDNLERLTNVAFPDGTSISYIYNKLDLAQIIDRMGFHSYYGYNPVRQKIAETNALGNVTLYDYCECGALDHIVDALTNVTTFEHDYQGNVTNIIYPDNYSVERQYNSIRQVVRQTDSSGYSVTNYYNNQGILFCSSNNAGQTVKMAYDIYDRVTNNVDADGVSVDMVYDHLSRLLERSYPDGGAERYGYSTDVSGPTSYTNQIGDAVLYGYDAMNRKTNEATLGVTTNRFGYSGAGDLLTLTDGKNQVTSWGYDSFGRVTNKIDAALNTLFTYQYDFDNRLTARWSAAKGTTLYHYDPVGNLTNVVYPKNPAISFAYDAINRLTNMVDGLGNTAYGYDAAGQLTSEDGPWPDDTVNIAYTNRLRTSLSLLQNGAPAWINGYAYDPARRLKSVASPAGTFGYAYDPVRIKLVDEISMPNGTYITNSYDSVARLASTYLQNSAEEVFDSYDYGLNMAGQRTNVIRLGESTVNYSYDNAGELTSARGFENSDGLARLQEQFGYGYDAAGNLGSRTNNELVQNFGVNNLNELNQINHSGTLTVAGTTSTPATNVTVNMSNAVLYADATFASPNQNITNDGWNTYTAIGQNSVGLSQTNSVNLFIPAQENCSYDLNGNLTSEQSSTGATNRQFSYDDENQLIGVWVANTWSNSFAYDGKMRRRVEREFGWSGSTWVETNEIRFIYDGNVVVQERDSNNVSQVTYTRGNDLSGSLQGAGGIGGLLARTDGNGSAFYYADGNGNITCMLDSIGNICAKYLYDPFGNMLAMSGSLASANRYRFSSKEWDSNSGLYYYLYRFYDPNLQRWVNRDPHWDMGFILHRWGNIGLPGTGGPNLYDFLSNSPLDNDDPFGLSLWSKCKNFCVNHAKDKVKEVIQDKLKEWFTDHAGGVSAEQAKKDCDAMKSCSDQSPSDARWGGDCLTCSIYKCALSATNPQGADACYKKKLIGCLSSQAP